MVSEDINKPQRFLGEEEIEKTLRPLSFQGFIGQKDLIDHLMVSIQATKKRKEALDHVLFYGPPGLGKTTLAHIIASELGVNVHTTTGPALERKKDIASILSNLEDHDILFIDEIHRLNRSVEETLYPAMEDFALDIIIGQGPSAKTIRLDIPKFTMIGATTRAGMMTSPLRARFGIIHRLNFYNENDLAEIILRDSGVLSIKIDKDASYEISKRSRGTPRIAIRMLKRVRDYAQIKGDGNIDLKITKYALDKLKIDEMGLDEVDKEILKIIIEKYNGGPVGIETISIAIQEAKETIEDVHEPYLIQIGFIKRTQRGRVITNTALKYLKYKGYDEKGLF